MDRDIKNSHPAWLSEAQWLTLQLPLRRRLQALGLRQVELRLFVEAVLCKIAEGTGWRQLPEAFGKWNTIYRRYVRWQRHDLWPLVLDSLGPECGFTYSSEEREIHYHGRNGLAGRRRSRQPTARMPHPAEARHAIVLRYRRPLPNRKFAILTR
jgi:hypothetical protein